ncbi:hypothetical protein GN958_ATG13457 [Phytophthora infestans]|uniref:Secreted protein n=1 Tax=Phytophthora infestans TaxID=4787 RepID=A0A8S9U707_PHYIN|nr:hypothetical protein GN958_ATG16159 [Phytophthora infestans]KAF4137327.1 hypothetical protein GN958_ATG13457 [Phytophthora infestans]
MRKVPSALLLCNLCLMAHAIAVVRSAGVTNGPESVALAQIISNKVSCRHISSCSNPTHPSVGITTDPQGRTLTKRISTLSLKGAAQLVRGAPIMSVAAVECITAHLAAATV